MLRSRASECPTLLSAAHSTTSVTADKNLRCKLPQNFAVRYNFLLASAASSLEWSRPPSRVRLPPLSPELKASMAASPRGQSLLPPNPSRTQPPESRPRSRLSRLPPSRSVATKFASASAHHLFPNRNSTPETTTSHRASPWHPRVRH